MSEGALYEETARRADERSVGQRVDGSRAVPAAALLVAGVILGVIGDVFLRAPGEPGSNVSLWVTAVAVAALVLHRRAGIELDRARVAWLTVGARNISAWVKFD